MGNRPQRHFSHQCLYRERKYCWGRCFEALWPVSLLYGELQFKSRSQVVFQHLGFRQEMTTPQKHAALNPCRAAACTTRRGACSRGAAGRFQQPTTSRRGAAPLVTVAAAACGGSSSGSPASQLRRPLWVAAASAASAGTSSSSPGGHGSRRRRPSWVSAASAPGAGSQGSSGDSAGPASQEESAEAAFATVQRCMALFLARQHSSDLDSVVEYLPEAVIDRLLERKAAKL